MKKKKKKKKIPVTAAGELNRHSEIQNKLKPT
jgi:hypothetical protein